jgi:hypothetical protein
VITSETLVDNVLTGSFSIPEALDLQRLLIQTLERGKFELRKWASNAPELLQSIPSELREINLPLTISETPELPTLGVKWNPSADTFTLTIPRPLDTAIPCKRSVSSLIARCHDPLGWISPVLIRAKILLQELWKCKLDWDIPIKSTLLSKWKKFIQDLPLLENFTIQRCYSPPPSSQGLTPRFQVIGFSDGSNVAYSAVIYLRAIHDDTVTITLVGAKARVAPVKGDTTPRMELNGAHLLSRFAKTVIQSLPVKVDSITCFSDSTSVLGWVDPNSKEKQDVYVRNRVRTIQNNLPSAIWNHVSGSENPADCASRGISAAELLTHPLWLQGPSWLKTMDFSPSIQCHQASTPSRSPAYQFIMDCSSLPMMKQVIGNFLRLKAALQSKPRETGPFTAAELDGALRVIIGVIQTEVFANELQHLSRVSSKPPKKLKFLSPFLDAEGLLRVGGRISKS